MRKTVLILFSTICFQLSYAQNEKYFELTDTHFEKDMICVKEIAFIFDKPTYFPEFQPLIDSIAKFLKDHPRLIIEIGIHTDSRGSSEYNQKLSEHRAQVVVDSILIQGISKTRALPKGYGETNPRYLEKDYKKSGCGCTFQKGTKLDEEYLTGLETNTTDGIKKYEDGHALNRRMEIKILSTSN